jgi:hypothetical protein
LPGRRGFMLAAGAFMRAEHAKWGAAVKDAGVRIE